MTDLLMERDALISDCGKYRYLLRRVWDCRKPRALVCMLNPSKADAEIDDATVRSLVRLLSALAFGSYEVVNLYGLRATDPAELEQAQDPVGADNDRIIAAAVDRCDIVILAYGAHPMALKRENIIKGMVSARRPAVFCFGKTKAGRPKHPLYLKTGTQLEVVFQ